jgi:hypothetical protein
MTYGEGSSFDSAHGVGDFGNHSLVESNILGIRSIVGVRCSKNKPKYSISLFNMCDVGSHGNNLTGTVTPNNIRFVGWILGSNGMFPVGRIETDGECSGLEEE